MKPMTPTTKLHREMRIFFIYVPVVLFGLIGLAILFSPQPNNKAQPPAPTIQVPVPVEFLQQKGQVDLEAIKKVQQTLLSLDLSNTDVTDKELAQLELPKLRRLWLCFAKIDGSGFTKLLAPQLWEIDLRATAITDTTLAYLQDFPNLRQLNLHQTQVTGAGLAGLQLLELSWLDLRETQLADEQLRHMRFPAVQMLVIGDNAITDIGLSYLKEAMPNVSQLFISDTKATDAGLAYLRELPKLYWLDLNGTAISDAGVDTINQMTALKHLWLTGTSFTEAGLNKLYLPALERLWLPTSISDEALDAFRKKYPKVKLLRSDQARK